MHAAMKVAIADDHAIVRKGYQRLLELEDDMQVVAEFADGDSAYRWLGDHDADVLILDLSMPGRSGLDVLQRMAQRRDDTRVLVFTMHDSAALARQARALGACGYVTKSSPPEALVAAVRCVAAGGQAFEHVECQLPAANDAPQGWPHEGLSAREFGIFLALAQGEAVERIAESQSLSLKTVSNYQTTIRHKTGLQSGVDMYRYALTHGLIEPPLAHAASLAVGIGAN